MGDGLDRLLAAIADPTAERLDALREVVAPDVFSSGTFLRGTDVEALVTAIAEPPMPVLKMVTWNEPEVDSAIGPSVRGDLPPGLQISGVRITVREHNGVVQEVFQEVELPGPPPAGPLAIDDELAATINGAFAASAPFIVSYVDPDGKPHVSFRGTVQVVDPQTMGLWLRDGKGGMAKAIATNPEVALLYRDSTRTQYEFAGRATLVTDPGLTAQIFESSPEFEQTIDPARRGAAVIIDLDLVRGGPPTSQIHMRRDVS